MSSETLRVIGEVIISADKMDAFKAAARNLAKTTADKDSGTIRYEWYLDEAKGACTAIEEYRDSAAFVSHMVNVESELATLMTVCEITSVRVFGDPGEEVRSVLEPFGATIVPQLFGVA